MNRYFSRVAERSGVLAAAAERTGNGSRLAPGMSEEFCESEASVLAVAEASAGAHGTLTSGGPPTGPASTSGGPLGSPTSPTSPTSSASSTGPGTIQLRTDRTNPLPPRSLEDQAPTRHAEGSRARRATPSVLPSLALPGIGPTEHTERTESLQPARAISRSSAADLPNSPLRSAPSTVLRTEGSATAASPALHESRRSTLPATLPHGSTRAPTLLSREASRMEAPPAPLASFARPPAMVSGLASAPVASPPRPAETSVHIGKIELEIRAAAAPLPPAPTSTPVSAAAPPVPSRSSTLNLHRHYLRGL
jgi:hypothetical protein